MSKQANRGYLTYIRVLAALPGNAAHIAAAVGVESDQAAEFLRAMRRLGLVHICAVERVGRLALVYAAGRGVEPELGFPISRVTPPATMIAFASLVEAMDRPTATAELAEITGISRSTLHPLLRKMMADGYRIARIAGWCTVDGGGAAPMFAMGSAPDAKRKPPLSRKETNARYVKRRAEAVRQARITMALAGAKVLPTSHTYRSPNARQPVPA